MAFDFAKAEKQAAIRPSTSPLAAIVIGPSSSGKSYLAGTLGEKTLYIYFVREDHGVASAKIVGEHIVEICVERTEDGEDLTKKPDAAMKRLQSILSDTDGLKAAGFKMIVLDGLSELEQLAMQTSQWKLDCTTKDGAHNGFAEGKATVKAMQGVLDLLRAAQRAIGVHYYVTCILDVKKVDAEDGEIVESAPQLLGYVVPSTLIPTFPDQLVVGRMKSPDGKVTHRLQFQAGVTKASTDQKTKELKKFTNFTPRIRDVPSDLLPRHMPADLKKVLELKASKGKK